MDAKKRKLNDKDEEENVKETCPHKEKCYRRNPHHFKEFHHPHLQKYLNDNNPTFPSNFSQDHSIYMEQLTILRGLKHIKVVQAASTPSKKVLNKAEPSGSKQVANKTELSTGYSKMTKTTFISNNSLNQRNKVTFKTMMERLELAKPYNIFFTKVPKAAQTMNQYNSISFPDLICPSLGELKCSLQINFMIDIMWLHEQYEVHKLGKKPLTILYGYEFPQMDEYMKLRLPHVKHHLVKLKDPFGTHHSKVGLYLYEDNSLRVVVSTANLYYEDWNHYNQGLWISPPCPRMEDSVLDYACAGPTAFKTALLNCLKTYNLPMLEEWLTIVKRADFGSVKVFLVNSVPGKHYGKNANCHVQRVGELLSKYCVLPAKTPQSEGPLSWRVVAQSSSLGSLGKTPAEWLRSVLLRSLSSHKLAQLSSNSQATLSVVYPTVANVLASHFGAEGGGCLPYAKNINDKQKWLKDYLHVWKADGLGRSRAMPHIKSYCRVSPCFTKLAWFLLTSANISKSAWGGNIQKDGGCYVRSYEMGVLFLPCYFEEEYFEIKANDSTTNVFPFIYDFPLIPYTPNDDAWCN